MVYNKSMEYLKSIKSILNKNNITLFEVITNKRKLFIKLPYRVITHDKGNTFIYNDKILDKVIQYNINIDTYIYT